ncbi:hypothetical protein TPA0910_71690 [Streptomyces hygroscopicus subsp. sporocinereus]|uniref:Uncharacterized protein n=1 Tax=Streptomyces hygroscopicus TaxID=1912 RepID=A0ABQ3UC21_STRHY|nr:hypothetical protein TPA0910_71690 [Streptomyces hygroscopicus]
MPGDALVERVPRVQAQRGAQLEPHGHAVQDKPHIELGETAWEAIGQRVLLWVSGLRGLVRVAAASGVTGLGRLA